MAALGISMHLACYSAGLDWTQSQGGSGSTAQGGAGNVGGTSPSLMDGGPEGGSGGAGAAGAAGSAGENGNGGSGGSGGSGPVVCPADDGTAAALTLAGLGLELPPEAPDASAPDGGAPDAGAADAGPDGGGAGDEFEGLALPNLIGWATQPGLGTATTIGGAAGNVVTARTAAQLVDFAARPEPLVIRICGTLRAPEVRVASHKTLLGVGETAGIEGGIWIGGDADYARNVIIKNLHVNAGFSSVLGEGVRVDRAHHVWIDHLDILNSTGDGAIDVVRGADFVTVSWTKFWFNADSPDIEHRFGIRVGDHNQASEADELDKGHLNVTVHHSWFADETRQRAPRVRYGKVHVFNTYYTVNTLPNDYSVRAHEGASVLLESNYFQEVTSPHEVMADDARLLAIDNVYDRTQGLAQSTGSAFAPPYTYTLDSKLTVPQQIMAGAGPE